MSLEITACRSQERHNHQGDDDYGQDSVAKKDNKVDRSNNANSREPRGAMIIMIRKVRCEKESRSYHRGDLAIAMSIHSTAADEQESANQKDRTGAV